MAHPDQTEILFSAQNLLLRSRAEVRTEDLNPCGDAPGGSVDAPSSKGPSGRRNGSPETASIFFRAFLCDPGVKLAGAFLGELSKKILTHSG